MCADGREGGPLVGVTLTGSVAVQMVGLPGFDNMPVWGFAGVTIRARWATLILFDNGIRTWGIYTIKKHANHLPTGRALTSLTRGGGKPPHGVMGTTIVTSWRRCWGQPP